MKKKEKYASRVITVNNNNNSASGVCEPWKEVKKL